MQQRAKQRIEEQFALMHEAFAALQQPDVTLDRMADSAVPMALDADEGDESDEEGGIGFDSPLGAAGVFHIAIFMSGKAPRCSVRNSTLLIAFCLDTYLD